MFHGILSEESVENFVFIFNDILKRVFDESSITILRQKNEVVSILPGITMKLEFYLSFLFNPRTAIKISYFDYSLFEEEDLFNFFGAFLYCTNLLDDFTVIGYSENKEINEIITDSLMNPQLSKFFEHFDGDLFMLYDNNWDLYNDDELWSKVILKVSTRPKEKK